MGKGVPWSWRKQGSAECEGQGSEYCRRSGKEDKERRKKSKEKKNAVKLAE